MTKKTLAHAIALTAAGLAFSSAASATVTTMYNMSTGANGSVDLSTNTTDPTTGGVWKASMTGSTDGWANGAKPGSAVGTVASQKWLGTASSTTAAFGYTGAHLNWGLSISGGNGGTGTISTFDSFARYGAYADIDTAKGAWAATNTGATFAGWRHDLDTGLFKSDTTGLVTLSAVGLVNPNAHFGFTVFKGVDSITTYGHHGSWNANNNTQAGAPNAASVPYTTAGGLTAADIVAYSVGGATPSGISTLTFNAIAGQTYTIFLGGYRDGAWGTTTDGYALTISQVPVPGAVWLFGSALAGLVGFGRRKAA